MLCIGCGYRLNDLPDPRCPECGRVFDPASPKSFTTRRRRPFARLRRAAVYLLPLFVVYSWLWAQFGADAPSATLFCAGGPTLIILATLRVPPESHKFVCATTFALLLVLAVLTRLGRAPMWLHLVIAGFWWLAGVITILALLAPGIF